MPRPLSLLVVLVLVVSSVTAAFAQEDPAPAPDSGAPAVAPAAGENAGASPGTTDPAAALEALLQDPAALDALIERLQSLRGESAPAEEANPLEDAAEAPLSLAREIAERSQAIAEGTAQALHDVWRGIERLPRTLGALTTVASDGVLFDLLADLAFTIAVTYAAYLVFRQGSKWVDRRLAARARASNIAATALLAVISFAVDVTIAILSWAMGYAIVLAFSGTTGEIELVQSLYLNAFLVTQVAKAVIRFIFAPREHALRFTGFSDETSKRISFWLWFGVALTTYGQFLLVPTIRREVSFLAASATSIALALALVGIAISLTLRNRHDVARWIRKPREGAAEDDTGFLRLLADLWWIPVVAFLLFAGGVVVSQPEGVRIALLRGTLLAVGAALVGRVIVTMLTRAMRHGIRVPEKLRLRLPLLEKRLNGFVPAVLGAVRLLILATIAAIVTDSLGLTDFGSWITSDAGTYAMVVLFSVSFVLIVSFLAWLALSSWVEYRLNPDFGTVATAREATLLTLLRNAVTIVLLVITLMVVLSELGLNIAPLIASAGVLGLAIGFGAQKMVEDIITGVFIQFENAINVGDVVTVGGTTGVVEKLTVRSVSLRDLNGIYHVIPFSAVSSVSNYMKEFSFHVEDMGIAYREDVDEARDALHEAFGMLREDPDHGPTIIGDLEYFGLDQFGDSAVVLRARIKTLPGKQWGVGRAFKGYIKKVFDARGIEIPFPHQTIFFGENKDGSAPPLRIAGEAKAQEGPKPETGAQPGPAPKPPEEFQTGAQSEEDRKES
ncbi:MAG: mechanosensitive ion channel domain-containing protein [Rubricella sp.]